ncbi:MAG: hypothetical protein JOZ57_06375 [Abitibacteriaceae bacterium]|nr:hypothetical protein [Abditibacteriaceae bacterium]
MQKVTESAKSLIAEKDPLFFEAVEAALQRDQSVLLVLDGFENDHGLLYACLWYAQEHHVLVTITSRTMVESLPEADNCAVWAN